MAGLALPAAAWADAGISARVGAAYSDNITLSENDKQGEWVGIGALGLWVDHTGPKLEAKVRGEVEHRDYLENTYNNENLFSLDATGQLTLIPKSLTWPVMDYYRQGAVDPLAPPTPANRQNINVFSTGPEATWHIAPVHSIIAGARYNQYYFSESVLDSISPSAYVRWRYDYSPRTNLSLNGQIFDVNYANQTVNEDYQRGDAYLRMSTTFPTANLELDAGATQITRDRRDNLNGPLARLSWNFHLNSVATLSAYGLLEYTDIGHDIFRSAERGQVTSLINQRLTGDIYKLKEADLKYRHEGALGNVVIGGIWRKENYDTLAYDVNQSRVLGQVNMDFSRLTSAGIHGWYGQDDYRDIDRTDRNSRLAFVVDHRLSRTLFMDFQVVRRQRNSTTAGESFTENRALFNLRYQTPTTEERRFVAPQRYYD